VKMRGGSRASRGGQVPETFAGRSHSSIGAVPWALAPYTQALWRRPTDRIGVRLTKPGGAAENGCAHVVRSDVIRPLRDLLSGLAFELPKGLAHVHWREGLSGKGGFWHFSAQPTLTGNVRSQRQSGQQSQALPLTVDELTSRERGAIV
jgi:hypothetical protein